MEKKIITRKDVAERAGVSVSVVSRALNNSGYVDKEKKMKILDAAEELGYYPHPVAMSLQKRRTRQILFFCSDLTNAFNIELYQGMVDAASKRGYMVVLNGSMDFGKIRETMVDGVIMPNENVAARYLESVGKNYHLPMVTNSYGNSVHFAKAVPCVEIDMYRVMECAVNYLRKCGHRKIALAMPYGQGNHNARELAFRELMGPRYGEELKRYIISADQSQVECRREELSLFGGEDIAVENGGGEDFFLKGQAAAVMFAQQRIDATAVIGFNDAFAAGFCRQAERIGIRIPEQLSVIGIDGSYVRRYVRPYLTSVAICPRRQGETCVNVLLDLMEEKKIKYMTRLTARIVEGESVKKIGRKMT